MLVELLKYPTATSNNNGWKWESKHHQRRKIEFDMDSQLH